MKAFRQTITWTTGIAIFSMYFGAGNVIFPLRLGEVAGHQIGYALFGLLLTAIGAPMLGMLATILFEGDGRRFLNRIGHTPGAVLTLILVAAIGPFAAMPRCITVSYAAMAPYIPQMTLLNFSLLSGVIILLCVARRQWVLPILGGVLSPLLLASLAVIIFKGVMYPEPLKDLGLHSGEAFRMGLMEGYQTMDLMASIMFSVSIWVLLKEKLRLDDSQNEVLVSTTFASCVIGGACLAVVYLGLGLVGAMHQAALHDTAQEGLLSALSIHILGPRLAIVANLAMALACLTTVISLAVTLAEVLQQEFPKLRLHRDDKISYDLWVVILVFTTVLMANLGFSNIAKIVTPIVVVCYPSIVALAICNLLYQLVGFKFVKVPVYGTLLVTLLSAYGPQLV